MIDGYAGSGKTVLALELARRKVLEGKNVLFLYFNRLIKNHIEDQIGLINGLNRDDLKPESIVVDGQGGVVISLKNNPEDVLGIVLGVGLEEFQEIEFTEKLGLKPPPFRGTFDFVYIV